MLRIKHYKSIYVTGVLLVLLGLGVVNLVAAQDGDDFTPPLKDGPVTPVDPDKGLSDDQIRAQDKQMIERQRDKNKAFVEDWEASGNDARALPRFHMLASTDAIANSLAEAAGSAEIIARVHVSATHFQGENAKVTIEVRELIKGQLDKSATVTQVGGPRFDEPSGRAVLTETEWDPILLPGDDAVLFLEPDPVNAGSYVTVPAQNYRIASGLVVIPDASSLSQLNGVNADAFVVAIRAELR